MGKVVFYKVEFYILQPMKLFYLIRQAQLLHQVQGKIYPGLVCPKKIKASGKIPYHARKIAYYL